MKRLPGSLLRLSSALLVAFALITNVGCDAPGGVADSSPQHRAIAQQALDNMQADWSHLPPHLQEAIGVQGEFEHQIMRINGVNGIGVGQAEDGSARILIFTEREGVSGIPPQLKNVKTKIEMVGRIEALGKGSGGKGGGGGGGSTDVYKKTYLPGSVPCGVSIGNDEECSAGTLGCVVKNDLGERLLLSNWHVLAGPSPFNGGRVDQSGRLDATGGQCSTSPQIGSTSYLHPISTSSSDTNVVDAGLVAIQSTVAVSRSMADGTTPTTSVTAPAVNLAVRKVGRTTGVTTGTIAGINVRIRVSYPHGTANFKNQIYIASGKFLKGGDSGSLMTTNSAASGYDAVGLCFAGSRTSAFANPIQAVLDACDVVMSDN